MIMINRLYLILALLLTSSVHSVLAAEQARVIVGDPAAGSAADGAIGNQGVRFGKPDFKFGRASAGSNLPGYPLLGVSYLHQFEADFDSSAGDISFHEASLWAPVLPVSFGNYHLFAMLGYRYTDFETSAENALPTDGLHTVRVPVIFLNDYSEEWIFGAMVMPTMAGDLSGGDGFYISAAVGGGRAIGSNMRVLGGVYYSHVFGEDTVYPGILFTWRPSPRWETYFFGPRAGISYSINDDWIVSLSGQWTSPDWNVEADSRGPDRDIEVSGLRAGLKLEGRVSERLWVYLSGGATFFQEVDIRSTSGVELLEDDIENSPFVRIGLNLRL